MQPLLIDPTQNQSLLQIMPCLPISTSDNLGWTGIQVQHHRPPAWENSEHTMTQHVIAVHHANQTVQAERTINGHRQEEQLDNGQIVIIPANSQHKIAWNGTGDFTLLMLDPAHLLQIAYESVDVDRFEIIPQFAMRDPLIYQVGLALKAELESGISDRLYAETLTTLLSARLLRHYSVWQQTLPLDEAGLTQHQLRLVFDLINTYLAEQLSLESLTNVVHMSSLQFIRLFKQSTGSTPHQYIQYRRVETAKQLLRQQNLIISDIAKQVGFQSEQQFSTVFRKHTGISPQAYREGCT